jgi:alkanesulfonate monooxygenase SsuD/methylene tetrahydromethanopterin reductase-like flavin-dependent oxidoreductase (luciferase family)
MMLACGHRWFQVSADRRTAGPSRRRHRLQPLSTQAESVPFSPGSISLGLYIENLEPTAAVRELLLQAELASSVGFDGVTLSEHHAGFAGYLPSPLLGVSWLLDQMAAAWSAACPILLPLRPVNLLLEDIAWLSSRHPGRLAVGFAPGFAADDFALAGVPMESRRRDFYRELPRAVNALRGEAEGLLADDPAVAACAARPVPVVAAVAGPVAAREAAKAGAGIIIATFKDPKRAGELSAAYRQWGGTGPRVLIRRCWLGPHSSAEDKTDRPQAPRTAPRRFATGERTDMVTAATAAEMAENLHARMAESGANALSIRLHLPGSTSVAAVREQIARFGDEVIPRLRQRMLAPADVAPS